MASSNVLLIGCGALGSVVAEQLARAGVGRLTIVDRDLVEFTNLQRQVLFDESDAREQAPKAVAAARRLRQINSQIQIGPIVADVNPLNIEKLSGLAPGMNPVDLIMDGTDNVETRYLINDVSVKHAIPWIYGACVGTEGRCLAIDPPRTPCLRCVFAQLPALGELPTCDTAGVLGPAASVIASLQVACAIQFLVGKRPPSQLVSLDLWSGRFHSTDTSGARKPDCPACGKREFAFLDNQSNARTTALCGRDAVQISPTAASNPDIEVLITKLSHAGQVDRTPYLLRCTLREPKDVKLTVFPDGRAIIHGITDPARARSIYARFIGS